MDYLLPKRQGAFKEITIQFQALFVATEPLVPKPNLLLTTTKGAFCLNITAALWQHKTENETCRNVMLWHTQLFWWVGWPCLVRHCVFFHQYYSAFSFKEAVFVCFVSCFLYCIWSKITPVFQSQSMLHTKTDSHWMRHTSLTLHLGWQLHF